MPEQFILQADFKPSRAQLATANQLTIGLNQGFKRQTLLGVTGSGKTFTLAKLISEINLPTLIIAHNKTLAAQLYGEMRAFFPTNGVGYFVSYYDYYQPEAYLPATDTYIEKDAAINEHIEQLRLAATRSLFERPDTIIIASVSAIYGLGDPETYQELVVSLTCGKRVEQRQLLRQLVELQYTRNDLELHRGNYRVRGEVLDIFPAESEKLAIRIEIVDEIIESISYFDPLTGKITHRLPSIKIFPKTHYVTHKEIIKNAVEKIKLELKERLAELYQKQKLLEAQRLKERTEYDLEMMLEMGYCTGIENYSRYLSGRNAGYPPPTLMDYLPENSLLIIDESHVTLPQIHGMYKGDRSRKTTLVDYGFRLPSALDNRPLQFAEFEKVSPPTIYVSATPGAHELKTSEQIVELLIRPTGLVDPIVEVRPAKNQVDDLFAAINERVLAKERVLVTTLTKKMAEDLTDYLGEHKIRVKYLHSDINTVERVEILRDLRIGVFDVLVGINLLREGLDLPEVSLVAILDADKEGFLRSAQSLIQTSGRAARNVHGKVIMYADRVTDSMRVALTEMERRRKIQEEFNSQHQITPKSIIKSIHDLLPVVAKKEELVESQIPTELAKLSKLIAKPAKLAQELKKLEKKMYNHAHDLEFEKAALIRDQIHQLEKIIDN